MNPNRILLSLLVVATPVVFAQTIAQTGSSSRPPKTTAVVKFEKPHEEEGSRIFRQNCSRCHNTPEGFSPSISATVVRHMGVRASLSMRDKAELLRFLNP
jgi:cytochrome c5